MDFFDLLPEVVCVIKGTAGFSRNTAIALFSTVEEIKNGFR